MDSFEFGHKDVEGRRRRMCTIERPRTAQGLRGRLIPCLVRAIQLVPQQKAQEMELPEEALAGKI